ncbi:transporter [Sporosarcina sp. PTS2304]|uniref:FTR1 family iron permease n=1 Tax=Sporosarcina sp. PTS2304 TaxID=2283194 RepID=UPI000E0DE9B3|nr:FTR1 family protein [Sporosarcina sp. PTS2304]AXH99966.1 transporter [Sporosarcina sp. PTS2304]
MRLSSQLSKWIAVLFIALLLPVRSVFAETNYSDLYISISDAIMETKQGHDTEAVDSIKEFEAIWKEQQLESSKQSKAIDQAIKEALTATPETRGDTLSALSKALHTLEKAENPVDELAERETFSKAMAPALSTLEQAIESKSLEEIKQANQQFISTWTRNERPVREQSISAYGAIETNMAFMRITLAEENPDSSVLQMQFEELTTVIDQFVKGTLKEQAAEEYSLATLIALLDDSSEAIESGNLELAKNTLRNFIQIWPNVEGEVRTKNASLYTMLENELPLMIGQLTNRGYDTEKAAQQLKGFTQQIALLQTNDSFSFWDSALILLREGLEALLIIVALLSFLTSANQQSKRKWVYIGALAGLLLSIVAAIMMSTVLQSVTIGNDREKMEGYVGLIAAALMLGVGVWMHQKSSVASWNRYISKQMGQAISKGSVLAMASVSFLSVFREGAETLVFYAGIAPKMSTVEFIAGIILALIILSIVAVIFTKVSHKIPIHRFFAVATILIYILAFKIIGVSLHTLQLTNVIGTTVQPNLPIIDWIGFYPTNETILAQLCLLFFIGVAIWLKKRNKQPKMELMNK